MSEAAETPDFPKPMVANAMVGAASPLWGYFAGAAMGGVAFWWAAKFVQPASYEALFARLPAPEPRSFAEPEAAAEAPFVPVAEAVASSPLAVVEAVVEAVKEAESKTPPANDLAAKTA
jgi:hypothetical protein